MGREVGKVTRVNQDWMTVQLRTGEQCNVCAAKSACSFGGPDSKYRFIRVPMVSGISEGNLVYLEYREVSKIVAALIVFLLPILLILAGYWMAEALLTGVNSGIWGALGGFAISIIVLYVLNRLIGHSRLFLPSVLGRVRIDDLRNTESVFNKM